MRKRRHGKNCEEAENEFQAAGHGGIKSFFVVRGEWGMSIGGMSAAPASFGTQPCRAGLMIGIGLMGLVGFEFVARPVS
jgi:hypothetical protein